MNIRSAPQMAATARAWPRIAESLERADRNIRIVRAVLDGRRSEDVGAQFGLSASRVDMLFSEHRAEMGLSRP